MRRELRVIGQCHTSRWRERTRCMRVTADDGCTRQGEPLLGTDDVHNAYERFKRDTWIHWLD